MIGIPVSAELGRLVLKCLEKKPLDRYQSFEEIRENLTAIYYQMSGDRMDYSDEGEELGTADLSNVAMSLHELGNSSEAIGYFNRLLTPLMDDLSPAMVARVLNNRANCHLALGNIRKALKSYDLAKMIDPDYNYPWHNSAGCYITLGDYKKALDEIDRAIILNNRYPDAYARRADICFHLKRYHQAIEDCNRAIALEPKHNWAYEARARSYKAIGDNQRAQADYQSALRLKM